MNSALWAAKTGLDAQQTRMAVISNNLANVNTTGFKRDRASFEDLMYQTVRLPGGNSSQNSVLPSGMSVGTGVRVVSTQKIHTAGNTQVTENPLDMALQGRGFFELQMPDGTTGYTRDGSFQINAEGTMVNNSGYLLQPNISIPADADRVSIGRDGTVSAVIAGSTATSVLGSISVVDFVNPSGLRAVGGNLFVETAASGAPQSGTPGLDGRGFIEQGALETSNVNIVEELVSMIETQRAYEINSKAISTTDAMLQFANNNL